MTNTLLANTLLEKPLPPTIPPVIGLARLAKMAFDGADMQPLWRQLSQRFTQDNSDAAALLDMALIGQLLNSAEQGMLFQELALEACRLYQLPAETAPAGRRVLGFVAPGVISANTPIEFLLEGSDITLYLVYVAPGMPLPPLPDHDIAMVLAAESQQSVEILQALEPLTAEWPCPVLNRPEWIPQVGRERLYQALASIAGIEIPATVRVERSDLQRIGREEVALQTFLPDGSYPLIVRPLDSHAGKGLVKIDTPAELLAYLAERPEAEFFLSRFVDYRSPDGQFRKYRVAVIEGKAYPSHLGISDHWMVHFLSAGMVEDGAKRAEEARFMERFEEEFGRRHGRAIAEMAEVTGLDYFGIDCSETADGKLLIFEADTALVVHNMDDPEVFPYKGPHMRAVFEAFRAMLYRRSKTSCPSPPTTC